MTAQTQIPGRIERSGDHATVSFERHFDQPIADVWRALTEPLGLEAWLAKTTVDLRVGGSFVVHFDDGPMNGVITDLEPEHLIAYSWHEGTDRESHVRFELSEDGSGTMLRLTHVKLDPKSASGFAAGWHHHIERLTGHLGGADATWSDERFAELRASYE